MIADLLKAIRAGYREARDEFKRKRWSRRFHARQGGI